MTFHFVTVNSQFVIQTQIMSTLSWTKTKKINTAAKETTAQRTLKMDENLIL